MALGFKQNPDGSWKSYRQKPVEKKTDKPKPDDDLPMPKKQPKPKKQDDSAS